MRFKITLASSNSYIILPIHYNALIQAAIYSNLSPQFAQFLHDQGFLSEKRKFRLFVFSRILGEYQILSQENKIRFKSPIKLVISSPIPQFIQDITQILLRDGIRFGNQELEIESLEIDQPMVKCREILVQTLSPVVAYSTMTRTDGRKYTAYFQPGEEDFKKLVYQNLCRKITLLYDVNPETLDFQLQPIGRHKQHLVKYIKDHKETVIKAYSGRFLLKGDEKALQAAIDVGLGSKNSSGFGLLDIIQ